ncbi:MAG: exonuclease [Bdellovibrionaceae bacterium]|nr:exonuclease [Bdellovibrio sp.]
MPFDLKQTIHQYPIVAFDTETSGAYPLESEIVELGAVKWYQGEVVGRFQTLLKPSRPMLPDNIRIHGITNEMVADAPAMKSEIKKFCEFIDGSILLAHHAPFDLGFLTIEIEKAGLPFPNTLQMCTSLIARALLTTTNHKLQTLVKELNLTGGSAHRAYDDAYACLQVFFKSCEKLGEDISLNRVLEVQKKEINWDKYRIWSSQDQKILSLARAIVENKSINIVYEGGQTKGKPRPIKPMGIVRNPDGDYIHAECGLDFQRKRFYLDKILDYDPS